MITFSTEFPLSSEATVEDVLSLACRWLTGSPHTSFDESSFESLPKDDSLTVAAGHETVILATASTAASKIAGLQYRKTDKGLNWITAIVARKENDEILFSVQVSCESLGTLVNLPAAKKPFIIKQVIKTLGGGEDGQIPVADKPFVLNDQHVHAAAALIKGEAENKLPIVYVSVGFDGSLAIDPARLAPFVSGLAHVVVEPSRSFSTKLRHLVRGRNVYDGTIGVYWPQSSARKSYYLARYDDDPIALQRAISDELQQALSNRRLTTNCTWLHLQEELSRVRINALRENKSSSVDEYVEAFDTELKAKEQRIREADNEIYKLKAELRRYDNNAGSDSGMLLTLGEEQDLYPQEIRDLIILALKESVKNTHEGSRRKHVVKDLIAANTIASEMEEIEKRIKETLSDYRKMSSKKRSSLESLGFTIAEDGKHFKIVFRSDTRYTFILPKTSSDHRAGKNAASDITNKLF